MHGWHPPGREGHINFTLVAPWDGRYEEFLEGDELSYFIISDGLNYKSFNNGHTKFYTYVINNINKKKKNSFSGEEALKSLILI